MYVGKKVQRRSHHKTWVDVLTPEKVAPVPNLHTMRDCSGQRDRRQRPLPRLCLRFNKGAAKEGGAADGSRRRGRVVRVTGADAAGLLSANPAPKWGSAVPTVPRTLCLCGVFSELAPILTPAKSLSFPIRTQRHPPPPPPLSPYCAQLSVSKPVIQSIECMRTPLSQLKKHWIAVLLDQCGDRSVPSWDVCRAQGTADTLDIGTRRKPVVSVVQCAVCVPSRVPAQGSRSQISG